jgi:ArsR family transcriptional regulator
MPELGWGGGGDQYSYCGIYPAGNGAAMELVQIYGCLCERTRLRILHLLLEGPLCVCHFQAVLREPQVKISKHLGYLRRHGLVQAERSGNMMIYRLPEKRSAALAANLACLQDCASDERIFGEDAGRLARVRKRFDQGTPQRVREACCR